jgi:Ca-activated chloride channel family protein
LIVALSDLRWGRVWREVPQRGIEIVFVLDVSRSMLAEDATPNRLQRAKQQIRDTIDAVAGDRVGLVIFAGEAKQVNPLTTHYEDFQQTLETVGPDSLARGGSRLGEAIQIARDSFLSKTNDHRALIVFTDGEDQESEPVAAAEAAHQEAGIRIFTVGLGDMDQGARIPVGDERPDRDADGYLRHQGEPVWSRQEGAILQQVADVSDGAYIPAGTKLVEMADVYHRYVSDVGTQEFETARINQFEARFQWFLAAALGLLLGEVILGSRPVRASPRSVAAAAAATRHQHSTAAVSRPSPASPAPQEVL